MIEFLHRIVSIFREYFSSGSNSSTSTNASNTNVIDETTIKENFATVYQLLEEMIDNGYPLTTEPNALRAMIRCVVVVVVVVCVSAFHNVLIH